MYSKEAIRRVLTNKNTTKNEVELEDSFKSLFNSLGKEMKSIALHNSVENLLIYLKIDDNAEIVSIQRVSNQIRVEYNHKLSIDKGTNTADISCKLILENNCVSIYHLCKLRQKINSKLQAFYNSISEALQEHIEEQRKL